MSNRVRRSLRLIGCTFLLAPLLASTPAQAADPGQFRRERFAEDWSAMIEPAQRTRPWHALKWLEAGAVAYLSLGGDVRWRFESIDRPQLGVSGAAADQYLLQRVMVHGDLRMADGARLFAQLGAHRSFGRQLDFPLDLDPLDLQQAFVEIPAPLGQWAATMRIGRQEVILSPWFANPREAANVRASYDGLRVWLVRGPVRLEAFATRPVAVRPGHLDNPPDADLAFLGLRAQRVFGAQRSWRAVANLYRNDRDGFRLGPIVGDDRRYSLGGQINGRVGAWDIDAEGYLQFGEFAGRSIRAWGGAGETGYRLHPSGLRPRIGLRAQFGSGDPDPDDGRTATFVGPFGRPSCCADPFWLAPVNALILAPLLSIEPTPHLQVELKVDFVRRLEHADAIYAFPPRPYPGSAGRSGNDWFTHAPTLAVTWSPWPELTVEAYHVSQRVKGPLRAVGADDGTFTVLSLALRF